MLFISRNVHNVMVNNKSFSFRIVKMQTSEFAILDNNIERGTHIEISNEVQFTFDKDNDVLGCMDTVLFESSGRPILKLSFITFFEISQESILSCKMETEYVFPNHMLVQFASINYGTLRGVLFEKTKDTNLNSLILPPIYFNEVIKEPYKVVL